MVINYDHKFTYFCL